MLFEILLFYLRNRIIDPKTQEIAKETAVMTVWDIIESCALRMDSAHFTIDTIELLSSRLICPISGQFAQLVHSLKNIYKNIA